MCKCKYCGKEFEKYYSMAGHIHACDKNPNKRTREEYIKISKKSAETRIIKNKKEKEQNLYKYKNKEFIITCNKCGKLFKIITTQEKFDKGKYKKYCSRSCANSHVFSDITKHRISSALKKVNYIKRDIVKKDKKPKIYICVECGKRFSDLDIRNVGGTKYCSLECKHQSLSRKTGGYRKGSGRGKSGWYHGIHCDSTWELAFLIYHLDNNIPIERCKEFRTYIFNNNVHKYYPDFIVNNKVIVEIKGYSSEQWKEKELQNPDVKVLYKNDIKFYLDYVHDNYTNKIEELYDNIKPITDDSNKKFIWIHKNNLNTLIKIEKLNSFLADGWIKGRIKTIKYSIEYVNEIKEYSKTHKIKDTITHFNLLNKNEYYRIIKS